MLMLAVCWLHGGDWLNNTFLLCHDDSLFHIQPASQKSPRTGYSHLQEDEIGVSCIPRRNLRENRKRSLKVYQSTIFFQITESTQNSIHSKLNKQSHSVHTPIPTSPPTEIGHNPEMCARKLSRVHLMGEPEVLYSKLKITVLGNQPTLTLRTDDCESWKDQNAMLSDFNKLFLVRGQQSNFLKNKIALWCAFKPRFNQVTAERC